VRANLSRFAQPVELDLAVSEGVVPVEMLGYVEFPPIQREPYRLTLGRTGTCGSNCTRRRRRCSDLDGEAGRSRCWPWAACGSPGRASARGLRAGALLRSLLMRQRWFGVSRGVIDSGFR